MGYEFIQKTIPEQLAYMAQLSPDKTAYFFPMENVRFSFKEMKQYADQISKSLLALGLKHGDHIGIWSYNCAAWVKLLFGAAQIGVIVVPLNTCYKYEELDDLCIRGDLNALFLMENSKGESLHQTTDSFFVIKR